MIFAIVYSTDLLARDPLSVLCGQLSWIPNEIRLAFQILCLESRLPSPVQYHFNDSRYLLLSQILRNCKMTQPFQYLSYI